MGADNKVSDPPPAWCCEECPASLMCASLPWEYETFPGYKNAMRPAWLHGCGSCKNVKLVTQSADRITDVAVHPECPRLKLSQHCMKCIFASSLSMKTPIEGLVGQEFEFSGVKSRFTGFDPETEEAEFEIHPAQPLQFVKLSASIGGGDRTDENGDRQDEDTE